MYAFVQTVKGLLVPLSRVKSLERQADDYHYAVVTLDGHRHISTYENLARTYAATIPADNWERLTAIPKTVNGRPARIDVDTVLAWRINIFGTLLAVTCDADLDRNRNKATRKVGRARVYPDDFQLGSMESAEEWLAWVQEDYDQTIRLKTEPVEEEEPF